VTFDFCLLLDASLSVYKKVDEEPSFSDPVFIKDILIVDGIPLLSWSIFVSTLSSSSSSESTRLGGLFFQLSLSLSSSSSYCDGALPLSFDCGLKISNCISPLSDGIYDCCRVVRGIWLLPFSSLAADSVLCCFFFTLVAVNFHSPGDVQLVKSSLISSG
jgi:hypothetical protein